jgi:hypothetical protein
MNFCKLLLSRTYVRIRGVLFVCILNSMQPLIASTHKCLDLEVMRWSLAVTSSSHVSTWFTKSCYRSVAGFLSSVCNILIRVWLSEQWDTINSFHDFCRKSFFLHHSHNVNWIGDASQVICLNMIHDTTVFFDFLKNKIHSRHCPRFHQKLCVVFHGCRVELTPRRLAVPIWIFVRSFPKSFRTNNATEPQRLPYAFPVLYISLFTYHSHKSVTLSVLLDKQYIIKHNKSGPEWTIPHF